MTTGKWMMVGLFFGLTMSTALSCGAAKKCGPSDCPFGCCDAMGTCQVGSSDAQCGTSGNMCSTCTLAQQCSVGICVNIGQAGGPGGGGGSTGGGSGGGSTGGGTGGGTGMGGGTGGGSFGGGTGGSFGGGTGGGSFGGGTGGGSFGGGTGGGSFGGGTGGGSFGGGGGTTSCNSSNCSGCCQGTACIQFPNNASDTTCGANGFACTNCTSLSAVCSPSTFSCVFGPTGGGGGATGGGGGGGAFGGGTGGSLGGGTGGAGGGFAGGETCTAPIVLPGPGVYNDSTSTAVNNYYYQGDSGNCQGSSTSSVSTAGDKVYRISVPANATLTVNLNNPTFDAILNLISLSSNCGGLSGTPVCLVGADDPESVMWFNNTGTTANVLIVVDGYTSSSGDYELEVMVQ